jgi:anti-sigma regulatory factor (Ser/Thr protein kinase)
MAAKRRPELTFRPRARMLLLLGDQLIRDAGLAVFELVKNAYDADATKCRVILHDVEHPGETSITIEDDGSGMSLETVSNVWLEPGRSSRDYLLVKKAWGDLPFTSWVNKLSW